MGKGRDTRNSDVLFSSCFHGPIFVCPLLRPCSFVRLFYTSEVVPKVPYMIKMFCLGAFILHFNRCEVGLLDVKVSSKRCLLGMFI